MSKLKYIKPENLSGYSPKRLPQFVPTIKKTDFFIVNDFSVGGDAPKDFIKVYFYGKTRRENRNQLECLKLRFQELRKI